MAAATYLAIDARSELGKFTVTINYDDVSLLIVSADVVNSTGDTQHVTVGTHAFDIVTGTSTTVPLSGFNQHMVLVRDQYRPPVFIG